MNLADNIEYPILTQRLLIKKGITINKKVLIKPCRAIMLPCLFPRWLSPIDYNGCRRLRHLRRPCRCMPRRRSRAQPSAAQMRWPRQPLHRTPSRQSRN